MPTYYVRKTGSDGAAGTSAGAAWATIGKALGASGIASGDTVYIGAGTYREVVTVDMTSATVETFIIGDVDGVQTGDVGEVIWTAYTTDDKTASSSSALLTMTNSGGGAGTGRSFLTFQNMMLMSGSALTCRCVRSTVGGSTNIKFTDCSFFDGADLTSNSLVSITVAADVAANWTFTRCYFLSGGVQSILVTLTKSASADYDAAISISDCVFIGTQTAVLVTSTGASTFKGGGVRMVNCSVFMEAGMNASVAGLSTSIPCSVTNSLIASAIRTGLSANTLGQLTESHNLILSATPYNNVSAGTGSISDGSYAPLFHIGQELQWGGTPRSFGMPMAGSPLLGFGGASPPSVDILNAPRPSGGASASTAAGAYERSNTFAKETGTKRTGANATSITGPGYQDFQLPVAASSTTVTVYVRWDATYAGTKPKMQVLNGTEAGVSNATAIATGSSGAWEQLSLNFTPTSSGIVTIRLLSSDTNGGGKMFADDFAVA